MSVLHTRFVSHASAGRLRRFERKQLYVVLIVFQKPFIDLSSGAISSTVLRPGSMFPLRSGAFPLRVVVRNFHDNTESIFLSFLAVSSDSLSDVSVKYLDSSSLSTNFLFVNVSTNSDDFVLNSRAQIFVSRIRFKTRL